MRLISGRVSLQQPVVHASRPLERTSRNLGILEQVVGNRLERDLPIQELLGTSAWMAFTRITPPSLAITGGASRVPIRIRRFAIAVSAALGLALAVAVAAPGTPATPPTAHVIAIGDTPSADPLAVFSAKRETIDALPQSLTGDVVDLAGAGRPGRGGRALTCHASAKAACCLQRSGQTVRSSTRSQQVGQSATCLPPARSRVAMALHDSTPLEFYGSILMPSTVVSPWPSWA